jgi:hypothetical protein
MSGENRSPRFFHCLQSLKIKAAVTVKGNQRKWQTQICNMAEEQETVHARDSISLKMNGKLLGCLHTLNET